LERERSNSVYEEKEDKSPHAEKVEFRLS
jgi:hypothetical protein